MYPQEVEAYRKTVVWATDTEPTINRTSQGYHLTIANNHLRCEAWFIRKHDGVTRFKRAKLWLNGESTEIVQPREFKRLWHNPGQKKTIPNEWLFAETDSSVNMPSVIKHVWRNVQNLPGAKMRKRGKYWQISIVNDSAEVLVTIKGDRMKIIAYVNGIDRSKEVNDDANRLLAILSDKDPADHESLNSKIGINPSNTPRKRTNGVEVRNTVVIRN